MKAFKVGDVFLAGKRTFTVTAVADDGAPGGEGFQELRGTVKGDPSFLAGKRTLFTRYLKQKPNGEFDYDWNAK